MRQDLGAPETVVRNVPTCCDHVTRGLAFDPAGKLYVQCGSGANIDEGGAASHAKIHQFNTPISAAVDWASGSLFADGIRNEVGIRFDSRGRLWGVENGMDNVHRADLGGDIHQNNPAEELNLLHSGFFGGYPYCWSQFNLTQNKGKPIGSQWAHENFINDGTHTDVWCDDNSHVQKPALSMPAHVAPLDLIWYNGTSFPSEYKGNMFISCHGSWDRNPPIGYYVLRVYTDASGNPQRFEPFFKYQGPGDTGSSWPHRPVGLGVGPCMLGECLYVSSDQSGMIIGIGYQK
jgi:glucose/arabinose dehydrogenase